MSQPHEKRDFQPNLTNSSQRLFHNGTNRRATGLLPEPDGEHGQAMLIEHYTNYRQLLSRIKTDKQTCCIKFSSEKRKSRGAILIFQGRILGVLYGRKDLDRKLFHEEGYAEAIKDLSDPETELVGHILSEPLAIATASLFIGHFGITGEQTIGQEAFIESYAGLIASKMPGVILVHDSDGLVVLAAYVFVGKMIALYSGVEGWLPALAPIALQRISHRGEMKVTSTLLEVENIKEVKGLTFALTGVGEQNELNGAAPAKLYEPSFSPAKKSAYESNKRYATTSGLNGKRSKGICIEQELLARQRFAQLVLG